MIIDNIKQYKSYPYGDAWNAAFNYLGTLTPYTKDGKYEIKDNDIFAIVSSYETKDHHRFETHKEYIDIQYLLEGEEVLKYTSEQNLVTETAFDAKKDIAFYEGTKKAITPIHLKPETFIAIFPDEPHMPGVMIDKPANVKKVVIKIRASLLKI